MAEETTKKDATEQAAAEQPATPAAKRSPKAEAGDAAPKAKKEKPPALEDKPFTDFMQQDYLPALKVGLEKQGIQRAEVMFEKRKVEIKGLSQVPECWQVIGRWHSDAKQTREFNLYFFDETIAGKKGFSCTEGGSKPSTLESFRIDERKVDLGSLVFWTLQRLNAQKWLIRN